MRIGVIFPQFEFGEDAGDVRDYAQTVEGLGYTHIGADDHLIGPNPDRLGGWTGWVTYQMPFYEPFALFSFMAGVTERVEFETCVLLLPQRQTVLVAKQAACLDILCRGQLRLGLGNGWSTVEYEAMGVDMTTRGRRMEEQIEVLRLLWTQPLVNFKGRWHSIPDAGINPLPVQRPIPIWLGGQSEPVIRRAARTGDGWMPLYGSAEEARVGLDLLDQELAAAGRSREGFGLEARLRYDQGNPEEWNKQLEAWRKVGATHISLITTHCGFHSPAEHIAALQKFAKEMGLK